MNDKNEISARIRMVSNVGGDIFFALIILKVGGDDD